MRSDTLLYLFGIVPDDAPLPPDDLPGIEGGPVHLLRAGEVAAVVEAVPAERYAEDLLDARLTDLEWVGERGIAHERVLAWFADRVPTLPLSLFSLHEGEERLRARLRGSADRLRGTLDRLAGRREWGVKLGRIDATVLSHLDELSPALRAIAEEMRTATPGRRFLLQKKRDGLRAEELRSVGADIARRCFTRLEGAAVEAVALALPPAPADGGRTLALHAVFLVDEADFTRFHAEVSEAAARWGEVGFQLEFTGPWPAYHFGGWDGL